MKQYKLLIVDDEVNLANMIAKRLGLRGCLCEVCYNGREALEVLKRQDFSLVLLDLQLPDIYGTEVLKQIKKWGSKVPVVILTGHGTEEDRKKCLQLGVVDFIHKPLDIEKLMTILGKIEEMSA